MTRPTGEPTLAQRATRLSALVATLNDNVTTSNEAIEASNQAIALSNDRIADLNQSSARSRRQIRVLFASVAIGVLALVAVAYGIVRVNDATNSNKAQAAQNEATIKATCEATNESRAKTVAVWETFTHIVAPNPTPEVQVAVDELLTFVRNTYPPRDCDHLPT